MKKIHISKKVLIITVASILAILVIGIILLKTGTINKIVNIFRKEELPEFEYNIYSVSGDVGTVVVIFRNENGIEKVEYEKDSKQSTVYPKGKTQVAIDYKMEDQKEYKFKIIDSKGNEKEFIANFEIPRIQGVYTLANGVYANEPDVSTGFVKEKTRYLYLNDQGDLVQGNWLVDDKPDNWYNYSNQTWANIYVEDEGLESYYVWIPRYCYKIAENERTDVKFINVYNEYIDGATGTKQTWDELESQGYKIPEAFAWGSQFGEHVGDNKNLETIIPGYWISKYQLGELTSYTIDYSAIVNLTSIEVTNLKVNTTQAIAQYVYALDGKVYATEDATSTGYTFQNVDFGNKVINVTALNAKGEIIASMTKTTAVAKVNEPDVSSFDKDTTFYVYWDENQNEHNEIPISKDAPENWYNYSTATWANIVTRNDGLETYYVWIPRYQYKLNSVSQRSYVKFIEGTGTEHDADYKIPEAFTFDGQELTGYWITKYQLTSEESQQRINAEMSAGSNLIRIKDVTGTLITAAQTNGTNVKYEYYLNGDKKHEGADSKENYVFEGLTANTTYTINIIARNSDTDEFIGAVTKKVKTVDANTPDVSSFDKESTYYVYYEGDEEKRVSIKESTPEKWYDYSNQNWANIVTTANGTETYFVWIPRYEYKILSDRTNLSTANRRIDVTFIPTSVTNSNCSNGYEVPEAFTFDGQELSGYWITKYQLGN